MKIKDIHYTTSSSRGCETCDYGSCYINDFIIFYDNGEYDKFIIKKMYEYTISEADLMKLLGNFTTREKLVEDITNHIIKINEGEIEEARLYINDEEIDVET